MMSTMMSAAATTNRLLPCSIKLLALACCYSAISICIGFCPVVPSGTASHRRRRRHHHRHASAAAGWSNIIIIPSSSPSRWRRQRTGSALYGYANVNDYFASFNTTIGDKATSASSINNTIGTGTTATTTSTRKYIGHGRFINDGDQNEGGLFDVNNYFTSFNKNNINNENNNSDSEKATATTTDDTNNKQSLPKAKQPPASTMKRMTYQEIISSNNARLCPKLLLTQRAIQSFIYLLEECRDPHSGKWIEDFLGLPDLGNYHGTGAINITKYPSWDSVLYDIMNQPNTHVTVSAKRRGRGYGGWSKNNPFLEERYVEFKIDIRPASLVQRLLSVRGQLASEFERDLDIITMVNDRIMDSYFDKLRTTASLSEKDGSDQRASVAASSSFDRIAIDILTNITEGQGTSSSPFRRGNFDLLYNLSTLASAHRLLRELQSVSSSSTSSTKADDITYHFFKRFYTERVSEYFDGDQPFGRGDDFIDALLTTPPSLVEMSDGIGLTDPLSIAQRIIELRTMVAREWKSMMRDEVKNDHLVMNDVLFRVMIGRTMEESGGDGVAGEIQEEKTVYELANKTGEFE